MSKYAIFIKIKYQCKPIYLSTTHYKYIFILFTLEKTNYQHLIDLKQFYLDHQ